VNPYNNTSVGKGWDQALGITGMPQDLGAFPQISFSGGTGSPITMGLTSNGLGAQTRYSMSESLTWNEPVGGSTAAGRSEFWVDDHMRNIPDHFHAHARPKGGFFGR